MKTDVIDTAIAVKMAKKKKDRKMNQVCEKRSMMPKTRYPYAENKQITSRLEMSGFSARYTATLLLCIHT